MKITPFVILLLAGILHAKINTAVSILPQKTFLEAIGGEKVNIEVMVMPGSSPHTYEPRPLQMKSIAKTKLYFAIGVEFEDIWLHKFKDLNKKLIVVNTDNKIQKLSMINHHSEHHEHTKNNMHSDDPHIWLSPANVKIIAKNIYNALIKTDPSNQKYYEQNFKKFLVHINQTDKKIRSILKKKNFKFMVFHPSWGYFAKEYDLTQIPIEIEGKNPKPKEIIELIKKAKKQNISAILASPEDSDKIAKQIADELNIPVVSISPMAKDWSDNLIKLTKTIARF